MPTLGGLVDADPGVRGVEKLACVATIDGTLVLRELGFCCGPPLLGFGGLCSRE